MDNPHDDKQPQDVSQSMQEQVDMLKEELAKLTDALSGRLAEARDVANNIADRTVDQARDVADVARAYPTAMSTAAIVGGLVGLLAGASIARASQPRSWYDRPSWL